MKILWHSNAPWAASGYGVQTAHAVRILQHLGHEVAVSAMFGLDGNVLDMNGVMVVPGNGPGDPYGVRTVVRTARDWSADLVVSLLDAWVFDAAAFKEHGLRWVPITPIDHEPAPAAVRRAVEGSWCPAAMTAGGLAEMETWQAERRPVYFPHAFDPDTYRVLPDDEVAAWRDRANIPQDAFVVGMVAANKGTPSRKNIPVVIEAFAGLLEHRPDSYLVLHTEMDRRMQGINVYDTLAFFGIPEDRVRFSDQNRPAKPASVALVMNALDVLVNPAMGEGFGVPVLEAAACGTPSLVGAWTAMPEVAGPGAVLIPREAAMRFCTLQCSFQYIPAAGSVLDGLLHLSGEQGTAAAVERSMRCVEHAAKWTVQAVTPVWARSLEMLTASMALEAEPPPAPAVEVE